EHMVPGVFVKLDALPLTPNGKLDRQALPAPQAQAGSDFEAPQGEIETTLAAIWAELLQLERVGRHDNFFHLGGHSLLAVRMLARLRQALGVDVGLGDVFAHPELTDLAVHAAAAAASEVPAIVPVVRGDTMALSFAQERLWFLAQIEGASQAYHMSFGLRLHGALDHAALRAALLRIVERHESLRSTFALVDGVPVQRLVAAVFALTEHDLRADPAQLPRVAEEEAHAPFDLSEAPPIRGRLLALADNEHVLLVTLHHIAADGWSMGVLMQELAALYAAFAEGRPDPLPPLPVQYADFAAWQRRWRSGEALVAQAAYWERTLAGAPALLELPTDRPRPARQSHAGDSVPFALDASLTAGLKALSRRHGVTPFMTVLAAWAAVLGRLAGQADVVIGAPVTHRGRPELEQLIGLFINTLALRIDLAGTPTVAELLRRVRGQVLGAQQHQELPFEQVVERVKPVRNLAHSPVFQVSLHWHEGGGQSFDLPGLAVAPLGAPGGSAQFDMTLEVTDTGECLVGGLEYATTLFDRATAERCVGHLCRMLGGMAADDTQSIDRVDLLPGEERDRLLVQWNASEAAYPHECGVHELIERQA
ncbi:MAG TPA: condensation domain-containing protein, partial [Albitalea sp.]